MNHLRKHFFTGMVVLLPAALTALILRYLLRLVDLWIADPVYNALPFVLDRNVAVFSLKVLIILFVFSLVCLVGAATEVFIFKQLMKWGDGVLSRIPMVSNIYLTIREMAKAFLGDKKDLFKSVVVIEYPRKGIYSIGFVTSSHNPALTQKLKTPLVGVFIPSTPNPTTGYVLFLPKEEVIEVPLSVEDAIRTLISGGTLPATALPPKDS